MQEFDRIKERIIKESANIDDFEGYQKLVEKLEKALTKRIA